VASAAYTRLMKRIALFFCCTLLALTASWAQDAETPTIDGFVTRAASASSFDVNGFRILCGQQTLVAFATTAGKHETDWDSARGCPRNAPYVGEHARIFGLVISKLHAIQAGQIQFLPPHAGSVAGSAVIDAVRARASTGARPESLLVRADGYWIEITGKSKIDWISPLHAFADVKPGDWIKYKGEQNSRGVVGSTSAMLARLVIAKSEKEMRKRYSYDPSAVPASAKQSAFSRSFVGINPKKFPPYHDPAMEARIDEIGARIIPAYLRDLPDSDPAKIHFRFQLIDTKSFRDALALPSGVILVPRQVVERLQNDSQVAAVLADNIAAVLERQAFRDRAAANALRAGAMGADAAGILVPGAGLLAPVFCHGGGGELRIRAEDQSGRVALGFLHDAGYDIDQAPVAWWLLASKKPKPMSKITMPRRAAYLYRILGECWNDPGSAAAH
jgi:hypothetical protein